METNEVKAYVPFHPVHPFEILKEELDARGISQKDFAESIGMKASNFSRMLKAKGELSSEMAFKLEDSLGIPYSHWMGFQEKYLRDLRMEKGKVYNSKSINANWRPASAIAGRLVIG